MSDLKQKFKNCKTALKIVIVGNSGTGKTSFCNRWMKDKFIDDYKATVMSDFSYKIYEYKGNYYKVQFWDIAGQDKNIYTSKVFTKGAHGCLIMCDITNPETLEKALLWKKSIDENTKFIDGDSIPTILIQNKIDLVKDDEIKNEDEITSFTQKNNFTHFYRTSCKNGININESMDYLLSVIIEKMDEYYKKNNTSIVEDERRTSIVIQNPSATTQLMLAKKKICCQYF